MAAVLRIKRQLNEDPLNAVLLNCKRRKTDDSDVQTVGDLSAVLKFAGTVNNPEEDVFKHIKKPTKAETEEQYKKHTSDIVTKLRQQTQRSSKNSRYKVINSFRSSDSAGQQSTQSDVSCTIVDIETDTNKENEPVKDASNSNPQFVYDLYYTNSDDFGEADLNEFISVYPLSDGVIYDSHREGIKNESDSDCSEDSNAENDWRNDYPDESDVESPIECDDDSITEVDMLRAMNKVALNDEDDLSSDDYDGAFGYDREELNGRSYSKFKAKMQKQMNDSFCYYDDYDESCTP